MIKKEVPREVRQYCELNKKENTGAPGWLG